MSDSHVMRGYIGVTDGDWAGFLAALGATEVNFWLPSPDIGFRALRYGEPFLHGGTGPQVPACRC